MKFSAHAFAIFNLILVPVSIAQILLGREPTLVPFSDVTESVGIYQPISEQFGGATVVDLDSDGHYDLILTYHNKSPMRVYFGSHHGNFSLSPFSLSSDIHGVAVAPRTAHSADKIIAVSVGGGRGFNPRPPFMYLVRNSRSIISISQKFGFGRKSTRGRVPLFMDMSLRRSKQNRNNQGGPDLLFINLVGNQGKFRHFAYQNVQGQYLFRDVPGLGGENEERAIVTDVNNDGVMELVHFSVFKIFKLVAPFTFRDATTELWSGWRYWKRSVSAVVEFDFNNDGWMDLYFARSNSRILTPRGPPQVLEVSDVLLRNDRGVFRDVSRAARIPKRTNSMGVTAEDFDNNGFVDVLITTFDGPDVLLLNKGNGQFMSTNPRTPKPPSRRGMNVMAVDYDRDGRVDYIVGQGWRKEYLGNFRLMRNKMILTKYTNYLHVKVGNEKANACTPLNAIVTVFVPSGERLVRRVGGRGAAAGGLSYIDTVHFGLGVVRRVRMVSVKWSTGTVQQKRWVRANQLITF